MKAVIRIYIRTESRKKPAETVSENTKTSKKETGRVTA